ncbi:hypothetical protein I4F81_003452 [Pyropia yezoensis]|uniref:Uncharacterized protein n=1 Tax=Pyropia yezoensis TaxID=2788 RepID=A0ACC3BS66_PYRYE|nr:hypothetical protein I4F81_003452 [Neopyropia yezoensis]
MLASTYVHLVAAKSDARVVVRMWEADLSAVSMDGANVNRQGVYNFVNYSPLALLYATARLGSNIPSLRHTRFTNTLSDNPFDVPATVIEALEAPSRAAIGQSTPFLKTLAAVVALLEADAAPLSSYAGLFACLRSSLDTNFLEISPATRAALQRSLTTRYAAFADPHVALAFYLDGIWGPARGRVAGLLWAVREEQGGRTLPELRDEAIVSLADGDAAWAARLQAELSEFLAFATQPAREETWRRLHPRAWWRLYGERFELWHPICLRLFSYPASAAGGDRAFKRLHQVHTTGRNRLFPLLVDQLTHNALNNGQLRRSDPVTNFALSSAEAKLCRFFLPADDAGGVGGGEGEEGVAGVGALGGVDAGGGVAPDANAPSAAADGAGLDSWEEQYEALPDVDPADVDAIVAQLLL